MRIFLSAGEASGDAYGAALIREIRELAPEASFEGIGGPKLRAEGMKLYADSSRWGAISIAQAAKVFFKVFATMHALKGNLRRGSAGLLICIDFGFANIKLARYARRFGWKVLYFVPPGSWRRDRQGEDLPKIADEIVTPFSWSAEILSRAGASAHWFGHPIKQLLEEAREKLPMGQARETIAVLPGSREHELEMNLPVIAKALQGRAEIAEFALAPTIDPAEFQRLWVTLSGRQRDRFTSGDTYGVLLRGKVGVICSGTATLEAALCDCPMIVVYQLSPSMRREAKVLMTVLRKKRPKFVALPNIILDREIVPELAEPEGIRGEDVAVQLNQLLNDSTRQEVQRRDFAELSQALGASDAITKTAQLAVRMVSGA